METCIEKLYYLKIDKNNDYENVLSHILYMYYWYIFDGIIKEEYIKMYEKYNKDPNVIQQIENIDGYECRELLYSSQENAKF